MAKVLKAKQTTDGADLIDSLVTWLTGFISMPREYAIVCAVYAVHSFVYKRFDSVPYLSLTSAEPQSGKTTILRTLCALADNGQFSTDPTKSTLFNMIDEAVEQDRNITLGWDECEKAARESDDRREVINSGYQADGSVPRLNRAWKPGIEDGTPRIIRQSTYCPKILAGIGSLAPTIKDRSIVLLMRHGKAERRYSPSVVKGEAVAYREKIQTTIRMMFPPNGAMLPLVTCEWLDGREAELWEPLFTTAKIIGLNADQMTLFRRACDLLIEMKHSDNMRRYTLARKAEDKTLTAQGFEPLGKVALRDMLTAFGSDTKLWTVDLLKRMNASEQWREYRGKGLNDQYLSDLIGTFGITPKQIKIKGKNQRGYLMADVRKVIDAR